MNRAEEERRVSVSWLRIAIITAEAGGGVMDPYKGKTQERRLRGQVT